MTDMVINETGQSFENTSFAPSTHSIGHHMNMVETSEFKKRVLIDAPHSEVFAWHERDGVLQRLSPPWEPIRIIRREGGIRDGATTLLEVKTGPIKYRWHAVHRNYQKDRIFQDVQVEGPFDSWEHTHRFYRHGTNRTILVDEVRYRLPFHSVTGFLLSGLVNRKLSRVFQYRHKTLKTDLDVVLGYGDRKPLRIAVTGSTGLIGSSLVPFLETAGHEVRCFLREKPDDPRHAYWDPEKNILNTKDLEGYDVIIHLAGENISDSRWTAEKKRKIISSRLHSTLMLSKSISELESPPESFLCASAIGYYGNRGAWILTEKASPGNDFISEVCRLWENATRPAKKRGVRVVNLRIGLVLTPSGGALGKMLPVFRAGLGARIGSGNQFVSWISIDDVLYAIYHIMMTKSLSGPVNLVSPKPETNYRFGKILSRVTRRPYRLVVPESAIRLLLGQRGMEIFLSSTRVFPEKLLDSGFKFRYPDLGHALEHLLGKANTQGIG